MKRFITILMFFQTLVAFSISVENEMFELLEKQNVLWNEAGKSSADSMPTGNGDIGLNVWAEEDGSVYFYISKTDAWSEDVMGADGLVKVAKVKISLSPELKKSQEIKFEQILKLKESEILITYTQDKKLRTFRIYVDANNPQVIVDINSSSLVKASLEFINTRPQRKGMISQDFLFATENNKIASYHFNQTDNKFLDKHAFGAIAEGEKFKASNDNTLVSKKADKSFSLAITVFSNKSENTEAFQEELVKQSNSLSKIKPKQRLDAHRKWWNDFWCRSWIFVEGDEEATNITKGYTLQRYKTACAGRGKYPIKFNGSIFTTDREMHKGEPRTADYRTWGGQYWFQNTRAMYWPRLMAGDFDMMLPLFNMYFDQLEYNQSLVKKYYNHGGAYFAETAPFYGGFERVAAHDSVENWTAHYFLPIIELSMMGLDYFEYTLDENFVKEKLIPMFSLGLQFYLEHFPRTSSGELLIEPCNSIEQFWKVKNPLPDIVGLRVVLNRMLLLPNKILPAAKKQEFANALKILPNISTDVRNGKEVILPYGGEQNAKARNMENPELYTIYPFRLYGISKPDYKLALDTFEARRFRHAGCWFQDGVEAAMLGLTDVAKFYLNFCFSPNNREPDLKFYAFWKNANDYSPDEDNGGSGEQILQRMILYPEGKKLTILPAFPENWSGTFRLSAPFKTKITGKIKDGKVSELKTLPEKRKSDIVEAPKIKENLSANGR